MGESMYKPRHAKIVMLGNSTVGKTSIVTRFMTGATPGILRPTVNAQYSSKELMIEGLPLELRIWDTAGQEEYRGLAPMYYRCAQVAIIVFDVTLESSFSSVGYWIHELKENVLGSISIIVCGNKIDLEDERVIQMNTAQQFATESGALYVETCASDGRGIAKLFDTAALSYIKSSIEISTAPATPIVEAPPKRQCC